jgi:hypothetical protein
MILSFLIPTSYEYLALFMFRYNLGPYSMQASSYLGKLVLVPTWCQNSIQIFSHLDIPHQTSILLIGFTILIPTGMFIYTVIDAEYYWHRTFIIIRNQQSHALSNCYQSFHSNYIQAQCFIRNSLSFQVESPY